MRGFRFDLPKTLQAAGVVLSMTGQTDRIRLLKVLYRANREALRETGMPLVGGHAYALPNGPLHDEVYALIKGEHPGYPEWNRYFASERHTVRMVADPGRLDLSPYEIGQLRAAVDWADRFETWELSEETHSFAEWRENRPGATHSGSRLIPVESLLRGLNLSEEAVARVVAENKADESVLGWLAGD